MKNTLALLSTLLPLLSFSQTIFINEIHYDNASSDVNEGIEVAGPSGTDLSTYSLVLYNGNGGSVYNTIALSGTIPDLQNGFGTLFFGISGLQNGSPDGAALVDGSNAVVQFLSYEGSITGVGGPADGLLSEDIGVAESSSTPVGLSLQLVGEGIDYTVLYGLLNLRAHTILSTQDKHLEHLNLPFLLIKFIMTMPVAM